MTDPIADLLARIRNALQAKHEALVVPFSRLNFEVARVLSQEGYIGSIREFKEEKERKQIQISLRYTPAREPIISSLVRMSRPGRRLYVGFRQLKPIRNGMGVVVLSTPRGILTDREAREKKVGGEILLKVW